jgi:hypothetical protein
MTMSVRWNDARTFLLREMRIRPAHADEKARGLEISQRIGWDPLSRRIRSWAFGSDGSHSEATWMHDGGSWVAHTASVQPDGSQTAAINAYTYDGKNRCTVRSLHTHVGGEHLPPVALTLVRTSEKPDQDRLTAPSEPKPVALPLVGADRSRMMSSFDEADSLPASSRNQA